MVAATVAMPRGVATTWPCPIAVAAAATVDSGAGTLPRAAGTPAAGGALRPRAAAACSRVASGSVLAAEIRAVLHELAIACRRVIRPVADAG